MEFAIVDMQGFRKPSGSFILKEFGVLTKNIKFVDFIKSPYPFEVLSAGAQKQSVWLMKNYHGIGWEKAYIDIHELRRTVGPILRDKTIYVKGENKIVWLKQIMRNPNLNVINIADIGCNMSLRKLNEAVEFDFRCSVHRKMDTKFVCAQRNIIQMKIWYAKHLEKCNIENDAEKIQIKKK